MLGGNKCHWSIWTMKLSECIDIKNNHSGYREDTKGWKQ